MPDVTEVDASKPLVLEPRPWRGVAYEERSSDRKRQLVLAAAQLLGDGGAAAVTMRGVTRAAGLNPRYFYESFADRDALLVAVYEDIYLDLRGAIVAAVLAAPPRLEDRVRRGFQAVAQIVEEDSRMARALQESLTEATLRQFTIEALPKLALECARAALGSESGPAELSLDSLRLQAVGLSGALLMVFGEWASGRLEASRHEVVTYCTELALTSAGLAPTQLSPS